MNCKQGDLAVIVRSWAGNEGRIVRCVRYAGVLKFSIVGDAPAWEIDQVIRTMRPDFQHCFIADSQLRPIRDQPGADETLAWKSVPSPEHV